LPLAVFAIPFGDLVLAVVRRSRAGQAPWAPDKRHLHHRLLTLGHSHARAVVMMYMWSALIAGGTVTVALSHGRPLLVISVVPGVRIRSSGLIPVTTVLDPDQPNQTTMSDPTLGERNTVALDAQWSAVARGYRNALILAAVLGLIAIGAGFAVGEPYIGPFIC